MRVGFSPNVPVYKYLDSNNVQTFMQNYWIFNKSYHDSPSHICSIKLAREENGGSKGYPYQGCVTGGAWVRPYGDVPNSFEGAGQCAKKCKEGGYRYWGLECPRSTIHCQCMAKGKLSLATKIDDQKCKEFNVKSGSHCSGPFTSASNGVEYFHGAGSISSAYLTDMEGMLTYPTMI